MKELLRIYWKVFKFVLPVAILVGGLWLFLFVGPATRPTLVIAYDSLLQNRIVAVRRERSINNLLQEWQEGFNVRAGLSEKQWKIFRNDTLGIRHGEILELVTDFDHPFAVQVKLYDTLLDKYSHEVYTLKSSVKPWTEP